MSLRICLLLLALLSACLTAGVPGTAAATPAALQAQDAGREPLERLQQVAEAAVAAALPDDGYRRRIRSQAPDPRLRLARCARAPEAFLAHPGEPLRERRTVGVRCAGPVGWTIYLQVDVETTGEVVVLRRTVARGERLTRGDLLVEERRVDRLSQGWFDRIESVLDRQTLRPINAGSVVTPALVGRSRDIEKGQRVELRAAGRGISVGMPGEALSDGSLGDRIRVRNLRSDRVVEGVVRSAKVVEILLD